MKESILNRLNNIFYRNSDGFKTHRYKKNNVFSFFRVIIIVILFFAFGCKARKQLVIKPVTVDTVSKPADTKYPQTECHQVRPDKF